METRIFMAIYLGGPTEPAPAAIVVPGGMTTAGSATVMRGVVGSAGASGGDHRDHRDQLGGDSGAGGGA